MKPSERDPLLYLIDIQVAMERVLTYTAEHTLQTFKWDYKTVDAVIRNFEIIGEATKNLSWEIKGKYPTIPWEEMYRLRNRISHEYFGIDYEIIWEILKIHLPSNLQTIEEIIHDLKSK